MLVPPRAFIVDKNGKPTWVPRVQLPFMASGGVTGPEHDFNLTALGPSPNGTLQIPAVTLHLSIAGGEVAIEAVEK